MCCSCLGSGFAEAAGWGAGLPLIVHERFLAAYDFIPRNAVAVIGPDGDAGAMQALLALPPAQLEAKLLNVSSTLLSCRDMLAQACRLWRAALPHAVSHGPAPSQ